MREVTAENAAKYLRETGRVAAHESVKVCELAGGVSNVVLLVELPDRRERFVLKQSRAQLRVKEQWLCPVERIWRETESLEICRHLLDGRKSVGEITASLPKVLWHDRDNYLFAMSAAPPEHQ